MPGASLKNIRLYPGWTGRKAGITGTLKEVTDQVPTGFIALPLVDAGARGHGQMETIFQNIQK